LLCVPFIEEIVAELKKPTEEAQRFHDAILWQLLVASAIAWAC